MLRTDLIKLLVLDEVADDYENFYEIKTEVVAAGVDCGLKIEPAEIAGALVDLLADGFVKAYRLYPGPVQEVPSSAAAASLPSEALTVCSYSDQRPGDRYYLPTPKGRELHQNAEWPLDDEGRLVCPIEDGA
jgi:hypothetical protein